MPFAITMNTFGVLKSFWAVSDAIPVTVANTTLKHPLAMVTAKPPHIEQSPTTLPWVIIPEALSDTHLRLNALYLIHLIPPPFFSMKK